MPAALPAHPTVRTVLREARTTLHDLYGDRLKRLVMFGSQARGDAHADSDIDLAIVLTPPVDAYTESQRTSDLVVDIAIRHGVALSMLHLSTEEFADTHRALIRTLHEEGIPL